MDGNIMNDYSDKETKYHRDQMISQQATRWFMLLQSDACTSADINAHKKWLDQDIGHYRAYLELQEVWDLTAEFADESEITAARDQAKKLCVSSSIEKENDRSLVLENSGAKGMKSLIAYGSWRSLAIAASLVLVFVGIHSVNQGANTRTKGNGVYQTSVGEQLSVELNDGSMLELDTQTRVIVNFSKGERLIALEKGQARFEVAHDKIRPFVVAAGSGTITALGTAFIVRKGGGAVTVSLIEGSVAVEQELSVASISLDDQGQGLLVAEPRAEIKLEAGEQVAYSAIGISTPEPANMEQLTAWQEGRLMFDEETLATVIEELNRYSRTKILLGDSMLKDIRVTGVFKTGDQRKAIHALQAYFDIKVSSGSDDDLWIFSDRK